MKTSAPALSGHALVKARTVLPRSLIRKAGAAARKEGIDLDSFIARAIAREPERNAAPMLSADESRRLTLLARRASTSPIKAAHSILRCALGLSYRTNSIEYRVTDAQGSLA